MSEQALRSAIIDYGQALTARGLNHGTTGNIGVRHRDGLLVTPTGMAFEALEPADIVFLQANGRFEGRRAPTSEWRFHRDILAARDDVNAVVHTHSPYATALAIRRVEIPPLHYMIAKAGGPTIRCAAYATFGTRELSSAVLDALRQRHACLLANHGMIACGVTLEAAFALAVEVEELARLYVLTLQTGGPVLLDEAEVARVVDKFKTYGEPTRGPEAD
ncbi:class II aldolase/adducin family protein [Salinisphaera sp. T31B1]|uniref:class II aldolase/adducin family protein n=1 Tax=Salinisphaera sp. T31B1 TaxID=727963 RepID=UPI003342BA31